MANTKKNNKTIKLSPWARIWRIGLAILVPLGGGFLISLLSRDAMTKFGELNQPPLSPPAILFPIAWTILYILMGIASYLIWENSFKNSKFTRSGRITLAIYAIQLVFNFVWTPLFFLLDQYWLAFAWLMVMWVMIIVLMVRTFKVSKPAFCMLLPYILWCTFAAYLNCGVAILN